MITVCQVIAFVIAWLMVGYLVSTLLLMWHEWCFDSDILHPDDWFGTTMTGFAVIAWPIMALVCIPICGLYTLGLVVSYPFRRNHG